jgi:putative DNA primase/helicase
MQKVADPRLSRQAQPAGAVNGSLTPAQRTALEVARTYPVFPCDPISKRPLTEHGFQEASQEPSRIRRWWRTYPEALVGVPTGTASGLVAIDVDPDGRQWLTDHQGRLGAHRLHGTRRGKHLLYRMNGQTIRNSAGVVAEGVDVRGEGGYVIWWPAHGGVAIGEPGELPGWLERVLCKSQVTKITNGNGHRKPEDWPEEVQEGQRNEWLSKRAYSLVKAGWGEEKILADLRALNAYYCKPPLSDKQLNTIVRGKRKFVASTDDARALVMQMSEIEEEEVDWLWKGFLARNKVHVIAGAGATMKSTLTLSMAATVTRGGKWPDGTRCPRGNVILWTGEDDLGDTVKPRFRFAGGDQDRCTVLTGVRDEEGERAFDPAQDLGMLERVCAQLGEVSLIIIDPIVVIVQKDNNSVSDVRRALMPLMHLAKKYHAVILGIQHFNKGSKGKDPVERITGSGAWSQAPRIVLATAPIVDGEGQDPTKYVFTCVKTFAKKQHGGFEYGFEEEAKTEVARIVWGQHLEGTGLHIISEAEGSDDGESKLGIAKRFLRGLLARGSVSNWDIDKQREEAGISGITLKRAKEELGIVSLRAGKNTFRWSLPEGAE